MEERFQTGDLVYAKHDLLNDGHVPGTDPGSVLVTTGTRGMVVRTGHLEHDPKTAVYLVRFEQTDAELGEPLGCLTEELTQEN